MARRKYSGTAAWLYKSEHLLKALSGEHLCKKVAKSTFQCYYKMYLHQSEFLYFSKISFIEINPCSSNKRELTLMCKGGNVPLLALVKLVMDLPSISVQVASPCKLYHVEVAHQNSVLYSWLEHLNTKYISSYSLLTANNRFIINFVCCSIPDFKGRTLSQNLLPGW